MYVCTIQIIFFVSLNPSEKVLMFKLEHFKMSNDVNILNVCNFLFQNMKYS